VTILNISRSRTCKSLVIDKFGNIIVADSGNNRVQKFDSNGNFILKINGGVVPFALARGVTVDNDANIYVSQPGSLQKFDPNGNFIQPITLPTDLDFPFPRGMDFDVLGNLYVADSQTHRVLFYDPNLNLLSTLGMEGADTGEFFRPLGVSVDSTGKIIAVDSGNHRLQVFSPLFIIPPSCGPGTTLNGITNECVPDILAICADGTIADNILFLCNADNTALDAALAALAEAQAQRDAILTTLFEFLRVFGVI